MAAPSPEDEYDRESPEQTNVDKKTQIDDDEFDKDEKPAKTNTTTTSTSSTSASPKTSDQGAPVTLVYVSLAAAALAVYAQNTSKNSINQKTRWIPPVLMDWRNSFCIWDF